MKKLIILLSVLLLTAICLTMIGCASEEYQAASIAAEESRLAAEAEAQAAAEASRAAAEEARRAAEEARREEITDQIINVMDHYPAVGGFSLSLSSALVNTFHDYSWSFEPYKNSDTRYVVTFTGTYSPNPRDLPFLSESGTVSFLIDIEKGTAAVHSDPNDICSSFVLLAIP